MANKNLSFSLPVVITKQGRRFVAYTPALDISTSGKSEKEVKEKFEELTNLFLEEIVEAGTANEVLAELGWKKEQKKWAPPQIISSMSVGFRIPALA
jgi:hypothetical protein